ncbi:MAG TPA: acyl carrier protein [Anaerolineae bacterium]|nr:acyl carrier protein [Anaerolineae bacterium]HIP72035.1 acyl carrier protein [Anaerolineae bacterium]
MDTKTQIKQYIAENYLFSNNGFNLDDDESFLEAGIVDSLGVVELVSFVEETYNIEVPDDDIVPDNFDSVNNLTTYITSKVA